MAEPVTEMIFYKNSKLPGYQMNFVDARNQSASLKSWLETDAKKSYTLLVIKDVLS